MTKKRNSPLIASHRSEVASNHVIELLAPLALLAPLPLVGRATRAGAGLAMALFQLALLGGGNLSFLNVLTLLPMVWCFDDAHARLLVGRVGSGRHRVARAAPPSLRAATCASSASVICRRCGYARSNERLRPFDQRNMKA